MKYWFLSLAAFSSFGMMSALASPLITAMSLGGGDYKDFTYGTRVSEQEIDCTQFMVVVLEEHLQMTLSAEIRAIVNISGVSELQGLTAEQSKAVLADLVLAEDARTKGIVHAVVKLGEGREVPFSQVREGDIVQYWIKSSQGWFGHSAVVESVYESPGGTRRMKIYGAHKSIDGVGSSLDKNDIVLRHNDVDRKIYVARLHSRP